MSSRNVCIIGPRSSGKTTYLASLAFHEEHNIKNNSKSSFKVTSNNEDAEELKSKANLLLKEGGEIEMTRITPDKNRDVSELPFYHFTIEGKLNLLGARKKFEITARDYPGEVFDDLANAQLLGKIKEGFVKDCFIDKAGCLMLLPSWEIGSDNFYLRMIENFLNLMDIEAEAQKTIYKMAVVMSKCERGEIWPGRHEPEIDLFQVHLEETTKYLRKSLPKRNLKFFAISTFGIRGENDPRPNRCDFVRAKGEPGSVLFASGKNQWRPYNLIEPLYWLIKS